MPIRTRWSMLCGRITSRVNCGPQRPQRHLSTPPGCKVCFLQAVGESQHVDHRGFHRCCLRRLKHTTVHAGYVAVCRMKPYAPTPCTRSAAVSQHRSTTSAIPCRPSALTTANTGTARPRRDRSRFQSICGEPGDVGQLTPRGEGERRVPRQAEGSISQRPAVLDHGFRPASRPPARRSGPTSTRASPPPTPRVEFLRSPIRRSVLRRTR